MFNFYSTIVFMLCVFAYKHIYTNFRILSGKPGNVVQPALKLNKVSTEFVENTDLIDPFP